MSDLKTALASLDPANDTHWTADGLPRLDIVRTSSQNPLVTREKIDSVAPGFTRGNAATYFPAQPSQAETAETVQAPPQPSAQAAVEQTVVGTTTESPAASADTDTEQVNPPSEQPEVDVKDKIRKDLKRALDALPTYRKDVDEATADLNRLLTFIDDCNEKLAEIDPPKSHAETIQDYLAQQKKAAEDRAARSEILKKNGISIPDILKSVQPSPLDLALANRPNPQRG